MSPVRSKKSKIPADLPEASRTSNGMSGYTLTVGLEIHVELTTRTKMFCNSRNDSNEKRPNVNICPVCMGYPGTLPVINREAVRKVLRLGVALDGEIADYTEFDRKNYFYPDIPKGYQISQYKHPLIKGGKLADVAITRIHLEEDTARSLHNFQFPCLPAGTAISNFQSNPIESISNENSGIENSMKIAKLKIENSLLDFNRAGVPLMELVTEPVIKTATEASNFARELQLLLKYLDVSGANMEKGEMRVEANISVAPRSQNNADVTQNFAENDFLYKDLTYKIRGIFFDVRKKLGLGHKEQIYHSALEIEFKNAGLAFVSKKNLMVSYGNKNIGVYQPDFIIEDKVIIELKALPKIARPQEEQLWSYLKGCDYKLALLVNFGSSDLEIKRVVYDSARSASSLRESAVPLGTKVEIKNLNSFKVVEKAIKFEMERQIEMLEKGEKVVQETRGWDENKEVTFSQRLKESAHDYRYFPDPDLPKLFTKEVPDFAQEVLRRAMPELPSEKRTRLLELGISPEHAEIYVTQPEWGRMFDEVSKILTNERMMIRLASNYITSDLQKLIPAEGLAEMVQMISAGEISSRGAKDILKILEANGGEPRLIAEEKNLLQESDREVLQKVAEEVLKENPKAPIEFLIGQAMKKTNGKANPQVLKEIFIKIL